MEKNIEENEENPFFFYLRRPKKKFNFKIVKTPNLNYLKLPKIKRKEIEERQRKYKELVKIKNKKYKELNSTPYSNSLYINGMERNLWKHVLEQYKLLKPLYLKNKKFEKSKFKLSKVINLEEKNLNDHKKNIKYNLTIKKESIHKTKSMPKIFNKMNNIFGKKYNVNIEVALGLGKIDENDPTPFNYFKLEHLFNLPNVCIIGFFDGKGKQNYLLSKTFKYFFKEYFSNINIYFSAFDLKTKTQNFQINSDYIFDALTKNNFNLIKKSLIKITYLLTENGYEIEETGGLISLIFIINGKIISVQIGNINSYFIYKKHHNYLDNSIIKKYNKDHNVNNLFEIDRVEECGNKIETFKNELGEKKERILVNKEEDNIIDYTRIFCYKKLNKNGIISEPDIQVFDYIFEEEKEEINNNENSDLNDNNNNFGKLNYIVVGTEYFFDYYKIQYYVKVINNLIRLNKNTYDIAIEVANISKENCLEHFQNFTQRAIGLIIFK